MNKFTIFLGSKPLFAAFLLWHAFALYINTVYIAGPFIRRYLYESIDCRSRRQGGLCFYSCHDKDVTHIILSDININSAQKVAEKINSPKLTVKKVDAADPTSVADAAQGMDAVIDLVITEFTATVMEGALTAGCHYLNTAFYQPFFKQFINDEPLLFDKEFREKGLTAILGCGMAPGFINVIARLYADKLDTVDSIKLRIGKKKTGCRKCCLHGHRLVYQTGHIGLCGETDTFAEENSDSTRIFGVEPTISPYLWENAGTHHSRRALSMPRFIGKGLNTAISNISFRPSRQPL